MNRILIYRSSIVLLLILNLATLFFVLGKSPRGGLYDIKGEPLMILRKLNLSEEVFQEVKKMGRSHHEQILELNRKEQEFIFKALSESEPSANIKSQIALIEMQKIDVTQNHFNEIQGILNDDQKKAFEAIKIELIKALFNPRNPPKKHPKPIK